MILIIALANTLAFVRKGFWKYTSIIWLYLCITSFSHYSGYHTLTQMAALCSKLCHLEVKNRHFTILVEKGGNEVNVWKELRERKKKVKGRDTKEMTSQLNFYVLFHCNRNLL
jgi:hypothetical protein